MNHLQAWAAVRTFAESLTETQRNILLTGKTDLPTQALLMQQMGLLRADNSMTDFGRAVSTLFQGFKFEPVEPKTVVVNNTTVEAPKRKKKFTGRTHHKFLSSEDVAKKLSIPVSTLQVWRSRRVGPNFVKFGSEIFYREIDVRNWIKGGASTSRRNPAQPVIDEISQVLGIKQ